MKNKSTRELVIDQIKLQERIQVRAKVNLVNCGMCDSILFHKMKSITAKNQDITCPYCKFTSDPCDFPDYLYNGIENNQEFND